jgi:hypothetical protein
LAVKGIQKFERSVGAEFKASGLVIALWAKSLGLPGAFMLQSLH